MAATSNQPSTHRPKILLPFPPEEVGELPEGAEYYQWSGDEEVPPGIDQVEFFVPPYLRDQVTRAVLPRMTGLRAVQALSAGVDGIAPVVPAGVTLCNARGVHEASTSEMALTLILASLRGIPRFVRGQDRGEWNRSRRRSLADRTVMIIGYGSIGAAIEDRLAPFECAEILRVARAARTCPRGAVHSVKELPQLLPRADVVVLITPLTDATRSMVNAEFLSLMQDDALLVNVARGAVVDTAALLAELDKGRIHAALDVTDPEPLPADHPLWHAPNTLISRHVAGDTTAYPPRVRRLVRAQLHRYLAGEPLKNAVSRD